MGNVSANDSLYAQCIERTRPDALIPQSLIDMMPSANDYLARLESLVRDFMPPDPVLTCTTMRWWVDRAVVHLGTRDVHAAHPTIQ